jgi:hypothetical protein
MGVLSRKPRDPNGWIGNIVDLVSRWESLLWGSKISATHYFVESMKRGRKRLWSQGPGNLKCQGRNVSENSKVFRHP